ncbi:hypothetical protein [Acrocarpospora macrocephala]|nr:hypothetical protein [Acrocarpospora macrocephala]
MAEPVRARRLTDAGGQALQRLVRRGNHDQDSNEPRRILSLGEAKWGEVMGHGHLQRLARARDLLAVKGFDTRDTVLACRSRAGFTEELRVDVRTGVALIGLDQLYPGRC